MTGWPPGTTWLDISRTLEVRTCISGPEGCRKKWSDHRKPRVDAVGVIHWEGLAKRAVTHGLYHYLKLVALSKNKQFRNEPEWLSLHHRAQWASNAYRSLFHRRLRWERSRVDRMTVKELALKAGVSLKREYPVIEAWCYYQPSTRRVTMAQVKGGALRGRKGRTKGISKQYRSPRV